MDSTKGKFQFAGLKFLFDMELIEEPQLINHMKLNVFDVSSSVKDCEFLSSYHHKAMLIWLDLNWIGKTFLEKRIVAGVTDRVQQLLPNFRFRVTTDRKIFDLALAKSMAVLKGETYEKVPSTIGASDSKSGISEGTAAKSTEDKSSSSEDPETKS